MGGHIEAENKAWGLTAGKENRMPKSKGPEHTKSRAKWGAAALRRRPNAQVRPVHETLHPQVARIDGGSMAANTVVTFGVITILVIFGNK